MNEKEKQGTSRRSFLKNLGTGFGVASVLGAGLLATNDAKASSGKTIKVLTVDGRIAEVDADDLRDVKISEGDLKKLARIGLHGKKFVMVIDLAKCKNARKCVDACQEGHMLPKAMEWMKVYLLQDSKKTARYWFPKPCFHCDNPLCVSVCPVGATFKREDGIVLVDNQRCIGCKFCMTGCPYSARVFNWKDPEVEVPEGHQYNPELNIPQVEGTVGKCVFCADKLRNNELPRCVTACPMGVIYFGDVNEDAVTNGNETVRFSELMKRRNGYRHLEELGTLASVFYLPPVDRLFPVERGIESLDENIKERYKDAKPRN
jgi:Fe-S-cluster-containing dehydrogenase component